MIPRYWTARETAELEALMATVPAETLQRLERLLAQATMVLGPEGALRQLDAAIAANRKA